MITSTMQSPQEDDLRQDAPLRKIARDIYDIMSQPQFIPDWKKSLRWVSIKRNNALSKSCEDAMHQIGRITTFYMAGSGPRNRVYNADDLYVEFNKALVPLVRMIASVDLLNEKLKETPWPDGMCKMRKEFLEKCEKYDDMNPALKRMSRADLDEQAKTLLREILKLKRSQTIPLEPHVDVLEKVLEFMDTMPPEQLQSRGRA